MPRACGTWPSPITSESLTRAARSIGDLRVLGGALHWVEGRPDEGGRQTVVRREPGGGAVDLVPAPWNVRSRVHEYGGTPYTGDGQQLWFSDATSGRLHRRDADGTVTALTPEGDRRFADLVLDAARDRVLAVMEDHTGEGEAVNSVVAVPCGGGPPEVLAEGHDFFAWPRLSPDGTAMCWVTWDHPDMPWDASELWVATLDDAGRPALPSRIAGGPDVSVADPSWAPDGALWWSDDSSGWWNLQRRSPEGEQVAVAPMSAETAYPAWVLGFAGHAHLPGGGTVVVARADGATRLLEVAPGGPVRPVPVEGRGVFGETVVVTGPRTVALMAASAVSATALVEVDIDSGAVTVVRTTLDGGPGPEWIAAAAHVVADSAAGRRTHAYLYRPRSPVARPLPGELPPLRVIVHGGPTSCTTTALRWGIQYWTSRGFAVLDVDHGGSSGYGREYRRLLDGQWGVVDIEDVVAAIRHVCDAGLADAARVSMSGGSAGGFTVLLTLTTTDVLAAGCSLFGVADLEVLARDTHKFESRYTDGLVGPWPAAADTYRERSPLTHADRLRRPVVLFQGDEDRVVPPDQSRLFFAAAQRAGVACAYEEFTGEGHGFRRGESIRRALDGELIFLCHVYGVASDVTLDPPLDIIPARAPGETPPAR